jgi:multidrug efflux pump subunit AcrA (membrane-fusion protein)
MAITRKKKSKKGLIIGISILVIAGFIGVHMFKPRTSQYTDVTVKKANIETYYSFSGSVDSKNTQNVLANSMMQISKVNYKENDVVKKDAVLFTTSSGQQIKSQIDGTVSKIYVEKDQNVSAGAKLCDIIDFDNLQIEVKVDEYDLKSISEGKAVSVKINSLDKEMTGKVSSISDTATNENGVAYFTAVVNLPKDDAVKVGMTAEVTILNKQADNVLTIPMQALQFDSENKPYVLIKSEKGLPVKQYVTVGINDGVTVGITKGVAEGQMISYIPVTSSTSSSKGFASQSSSN